MLFSKTIELPANTLRGDPLSTFMPIVEGVVRRVWVRWRWGSANLGGVKILHASFQRWPLSMTEWFPSTTHELSFDAALLIDDYPHDFEIVGYNEDDTFPHTVWVAFSIERVGPLAGSQAFLNFLNVREAGG